MTPTHSRLASSPMHGAGETSGGEIASSRRHNPKSPLPPRTPSNTKQRPGHRPAKSLDFSSADASQQQLSASESSVSKYYRREDRLAEPGDNEHIHDQKAKLSHQHLRNCDTITTAQETMSHQRSIFASSSLSASAGGSSNPVANTSCTKNGARHQDHHHQPILISTHHQAEQYQGIEIFSPRVRSERPRRRYDDDELGEDDIISDASSISTAMSTLAHDDPQQRQVKITGIQRAIRKNYEIIQASSSESTDDDDDDDAMQSKAKSLMDVAGTFSGDSDEDDEYRMLDKMSDQTKMFQEWLTMGLSGGGGSGCNGGKDNGHEAKASWIWKPAPLDIPATLERQSDGRDGLLSSLGGASSSRRSLISRGLVPEESSKTMMAEHNKGIEQKHFREHSNSAQEFLQSAEKLEQRARKREEERGRSGGERDEAADGGMSSILKMVGESFFKCTGY